MLSNKDPSSRQHLLVTSLLLLLSIWATALTVLSISSETLRTPILTTLSTEPEPSFYIGISVYITIGASLLTIAAIRIALRVTK